MVPRILDLIAVAAVAAVLLLPKPSLEAKPALEGAPLDLERVAALEDARFTTPDKVGPAVALAQAYLDLEHPDWAISTLAQFDHAGDYRVQLLQATAHAERLEAQATVDSAKRGLDECQALPAGCPVGAQVKLHVISGAMQALLDGKIDPKKDPRRAREAVSHVLHEARVPTPAGR